LTIGLSLRPGVWEGRNPPLSEVEPPFFKPASTSLGPAPVSRLVDMMERCVYVCDDVNRSARKWDEGMRDEE
jgi:hypothetical protein